MPVYHGRVEEAAFYELFFASVAHWVPVNEALLSGALDEACTSGMPALDALHVACAAAANAAELVTAEGPAKPIHRAKAVKVVTIHPPG